MVWLKDGNALNTHTRKYRNYGLKKRLLVRNVVEEDAGMYECTFSLNSTEKGRAEVWRECVCVLWEAEVGGEIINQAVIPWVICALWQSVIQDNVTHIALC